ncbi:MAG: hypothetical protein KDB57_04645 [Solirubrobacterales bacterium]|nr:hypothetical protein [Solirubrobacterales bacterium]
MTEPFAEMLTGGHPNSLGRTEQVVGIVVDDRNRLDELFACLDSPDELVRMRAGDGLEKVCRERQEWFVPWADRFLAEFGRIDQPSVKWHTAQILDHLRADLTDQQRQQANDLLIHYLDESDDWIVLNTSAGILTRWAGPDPKLARSLRPRLERLTNDRRKSVARRATKSLESLNWLEHQ